MIAALLFLAAGTQLPSVSVDSPAMQAEVRRALAGYATCLLQRRGPAVEGMLAKPYDDRISKVSRDLHDVDCPLATESTRFRPELLRFIDGLSFRGVLFQALIARDRSRLGAMVDPGQAAFVTGRMWPGSPAAAYRRWIDMGRCVIGRDAAQAGTLALAPAGSVEEAAAFAALANPRGKCGWRKEGIALMRGSLSEIAYRASIRPATTASTEGSR